MAQGGVVRLGYFVDSVSKLLKFYVDGNVITSTVLIAESSPVDLTIIVFNYDTVLLFVIYKDYEH